MNIDQSNAKLTFMTKMGFWNAVLPALLVVAGSGCQISGPATRDGAGLGALAGGLIGAAAGEQNGNALPGAALGATFGALTGGAIGNSIDQANSDAQQRVAYAQQNSGRIQEVVSMSQSGLSDQVIINQIQSSGYPFRLSSNDLVQLKRSGVSDGVIAALQNSGAPNYYPNQNYSPATYPAGPPVIVHEYWAPNRRRYCPPQRRSRYAGGRRNSRFGFSISSGF